MARLPNGMIAFIGNQTLPGPKLLDIEVTNTFPLIKLEPEAYLVHSGGQTEDISGYDHIAIPPDFRLHVSGKSDHLFLDVNSVWKALEYKTQAFWFFTFIGLPFGRVPPLVEPGKTKTWHEGAMIFPFKDKDFNQSTRLFVDFFLHNLHTDPDKITAHPFAIPTMRLAADQHGCIFGPHSFASTQRKKQPIQDVAITMRFGYVNIADNAAVYVYTPLEIFQKRPRRS